MMLPKVKALILGFFLFLIPFAAFAGQTAPLSDIQMQEYIKHLVQDRADMQVEIDRLKLQLDEQERLDQEKAAVLADYWKRYVDGLSPKSVADIGKSPPAKAK